MTCYTVYLYDKDNDCYSNSFVCGTEEQARTIAEGLEPLVKKDMIINREYHNEPFDWIEIMEYSNEGNKRIAVYPEG